MNNEAITSGKILVIDDDRDVLLAAKLFLKQYVRQVHTETDPRNIPTLMANDRYDVILLDMNFTRDVTSGQEGFHWLGKILDIDPSAIVVLITAFGDIDTAVKAIKTGATDFVIKPWQNEKLLATISAAFSLRSSRLEAAHLRSRQAQLCADLDQPFHDFIGDSPAIRNVFGLIDKVAVTDANVLILGENGTGKELAARAVHRQSNRKDEVFVKVDMGALTESLFESELFGHVKGAFTDAREDRAGRFEIASGGTLFLDEIGNLPLPLQTKLLTVLQSRQVIRIGSNHPRPIDIRLICASNTPPAELVAQHKFREDLLYRINTVEIHLPPLRQRVDDIVLLANHFLNRYSKKYSRSCRGIEPDAISRLRKYHWPGNVRELQHAIERAVILSGADVLQSGDFPLNSAVPQKDGLVFDNYDLDEVEKLIIRRVLDRNAGNISRASEELGLSRAALYRRLQKHGI